MTCCAEPDRPPRAALREALARPWKAPRFAVPEHLKIEPLVEKLRERFGGVGKPLRPPNDLLREAEQRLIASNGDIHALTEKRQKRAIPWFLWTSERAWHRNRRLVDDLLTWAADNWRSAPLRLWSHYLLHLDPDCYATQKCAQWLERRQDRLPERLREFSRDWALFQPKPAIDKLARALLTDMDAIAQIQGLGIARHTVLKSTLLVRVLIRLGEVLAKHTDDCQATKTLDCLLEPLGETPIYKMEAAQDLKQKALKSLVEGLVWWAQGRGEPRIAQTLDLLHWLIGDPRLHFALWIGIDEDVRKIVEGWLTRITLDAFFRFMMSTNKDLSNGNSDMVKEREAFWRGYQNAISHAWLIVGNKFIADANKALNDSFATFSQSGADPDHLGLLLGIGSYIVLEMNKDGYTLFWPAGDPSMPKLYLKRCNRASLLHACTYEVKIGDNLAVVPERFRSGHRGPWQDKYHRIMQERLGVTTP